MDRLTRERLELARDVADALDAADRAAGDPASDVLELDGLVLRATGARRYGQRTWRAEVPGGWLVVGHHDAPDMDGVHWTALLFRRVETRPDWHATSSIASGTGATAEAALASLRADCTAIHTVVATFAIGVRS
jgi:hypothetical protein